MKYKTTAKAVKEGTPRGCLLSVPYCDAQHLLQGHNPVAYTSGVYGWNFDVYEVNGMTICTGYRGMPGRDAKNVRDYDRKAERIWHDYKTPYETRRDAVEDLLEEFLQQA